MKNIIRASALLLVLTLLFLPVLACTVSAEDTTDMIESTDTPSGKDTEDGGLIGEITGALTSDAEKDTEKDTDKDTKEDTEKDGLMSDVESMMPDKDKGDGSISTGDDGTIDETAKDDGTGMNTWVILIAIIIIVAVLILIFAMIPKRKS